MTTPVLAGWAPAALVPAVQISTGLGWGGTLAWVCSVGAVVLLALVARWVARPARREKAPGDPRRSRTYRVPAQPGDRGDNPGA